MYGSIFTSTNKVSPTGSRIVDNQFNTVGIKYSDTAEVAKELFIIGLPDYILAAINSKGTDTNTFLSRLNDTLLVTGNFFDNDSVSNFLKEYLSTYDISDIYTFNRILSEKLELPIPSGFRQEYAYNAYESEAGKQSSDRIVNHYNDDELNLVSILVSKINNVNILPFEIKSSERCIFILPKKGFTNFITKNVSEFKTYFLNFILIFMRKLYGEKATYNSDVFRTFSRLVYVNC